MQNNKTIYLLHQTLPSGNLLWTACIGEPTQGHVQSIRTGQSAASHVQMRVANSQAVFQEVCKELAKQDMKVRLQHILPATVSGPERSRAVLPASASGPHLVTNFVQSFLDLSTKGIAWVDPNSPEHIQEVEITFGNKSSLKLRPTNGRIDGSKLSPGSGGLVSVLTGKDEAGFTHGFVLKTQNFANSKNNMISYVLPNDASWQQEISDSCKEAFKQYVLQGKDYSNAWVLPAMKVEIEYCHPKYKELSEICELIGAELKYYVLEHFDENGNSVQHSDHTASSENTAVQEIRKLISKCKQKPFFAKLEDSWPDLTETLQFVNAIFVVHQGPTLMNEIKQNIDRIENLASNLRNEGMFQGLLMFMGEGDYCHAKSLETFVNENSVVPHTLLDNALLLLLDAGFQCLQECLPTDGTPLRILQDIKLDNMVLGKKEVGVLNTLQNWKGFFIDLQFFEAATLCQSEFSEEMDKNGKAVNCENFVSDTFVGLYSHCFYPYTEEMNHQNPPIIKKCMQDLYRSREGRQYSIPLIHESMKVRQNETRLTVFCMMYMLEHVCMLLVQHYLSTYWYILNNGEFTNWRPFPINPGLPIKAQMAKVEETVTAMVQAIKLQTESARATHSRHAKLFYNVMRRYQTFCRRAIAFVHRHASDSEDLLSEETLDLFESNKPCRSIEDVKLCLEEIVTKTKNEIAILLEANKDTIFEPNNKNTWTDSFFETAQVLQELDSDY